ncbi:UDP-N-acetylmuramoyl-tripeptide--D-alanyl-D-alanine ligase [Oscillospiraceae bacterium MB08-C2-2]|nr:UDP-N-acetylmuramoyl-tripeptide--D-alanyl-D-alanine ligase [Oscillospiraceae bacterium MB08-C2-2]
MEKISMAELAGALSLDYTGDAWIGAVSTDSRSIPPGCLFIALEGENFDGHQYIAQALEQGAAFALAHKPGDYPAGRVFIVKDTRQALLDVAGFYRRQLGIPVVGVTGSVGKTTTKEMIACVMAQKYKTLKNEANLNNEIGLSQTVLGLTGEHEAAVLEMGMDGPGQIHQLTLCARPDVAVVTNIGVSHLERLGSRENILQEKLSITDGMVPGSTVILCGDNDLLSQTELPNFKVLRYGLENKDCQVIARQILSFSTHTNFVISFDGNAYDAQIPTMGRHNVLNSLAAFCVAIALEIPPQKAIAALRGYRPAGMRQNIVQHAAYTVVEDCYNASPDSMRSALETLGQLKCTGRKIAVLSDMLELGPIEKEAHFQAGREAAENGVEVLLSVGELAREYHRGALEAGIGKAVHYEDKEALFQELAQLVAPGDIVWFKASRGMRLEEVIHRLYAQ